MHCWACFCIDTMRRSMGWVVTNFLTHFLMYPTHPLLKTDLVNNEWYAIPVCESMYHYWIMLNLFSIWYFSLSLHIMMFVIDLKLKVIMSWHKVNVEIISCWSLILIWWATHSVSLSQRRRLVVLFLMVWFDA